MSTWVIPPKLGYALFVAGDTRLGEDARPALNGVLETLQKGPPPVVDLRAWIVEFGRMGILPIETLRQQLPPPELFALAADSSEATRLANASNAMLVAAGDGAALDARAPWGLLVLATTMASATGGVVYDSGTLRLVPQWILANPLDGFLLGSVKNHVAILSSASTAGTQRATTLGLNKYGLFELELTDAPATLENLGVLLGGLAQALLDARPATAGAWDVPPFLDVTRFHVAHASALEPAAAETGKARFRLVPKSEGDAYWRVAGPDGDLDEAYLRGALAALGIGPDDATSQALQQATRIARNRLGEARDAFARRALTRDVVLVKKAFETSDARVEDVWLRVEDWKGARLSAVVTREVSALGGLQIGDQVLLDDGEIVDWSVERASGDSVGNFRDAARNAVRSE